ncbi:TPA: hypothetical protein ACVU00_003115 [Vibrio cholerae]|uniref:hypothetical protein n=1 Tax=Vibrio cholerae TaxID=666 RepID=UPI001A2CDF50|nr:hypothetical protein [Vibrio cholerae]EKF9173981.1 hypothetical protein [Vibrio cholerae]HAS3639025.1 hypothetical protein [Vibrio cholerae]HBK7244814.1 hypothetical protein [Vibrio cholerae]
MNITINEKPSAQSYLESLARKLSGCFNSVAFKTACGTEARYFRFHRKGDNPKTIQVPTLANRSVKLNLADKSQNGKPTIITHKQGSLVVSKPCKEGLMLSAAIQLNDSEVSGHITDLSLQQEIETVTETINDTLNKEILGLIEESEDFEKLVKVMPETSSGTGLKARGEALQESIFTAKAEVLPFGKELSDYIVGLSDAAFTALEYSARVNGFSSIHEMMGTEVFAFTSKTDETGDKNYGYLIPRRHTAISFAESATGEVFKFEVTRKPETQSSIMEIIANAEVLAAGFTKLDVDGQTVDVTMPLITQFSLKIA